MAPLQIFLWACLIGIVAYFVHYELQETTVKFTDEIFIHAKRSDVYSYMNDVKLLAEIHPSATGLSDVVTRKTEDGYEETHFVLHKSINQFGLYDIPSDISGVLREIEPGIKVEMTGQSEFLKITINCSVVDHKDGDKNGVLFIDSVEYTAMRFLKHIFLREAVNVHQVILKRLKEHIEREHPMTQQRS